MGLGSAVGCGLPLELLYMSSCTSCCDGGRTCGSAGARAGSCWLVWGLSREKLRGDGIGGPVVEASETRDGFEDGERLDMETSGMGCFGLGGIMGTRDCESADSSWVREGSSGAFGQDGGEAGECGWCGCHSTCRRLSRPFGRSTDIERRPHRHGRREYEWVQLRAADEIDRQK